jgi:hypothetical protein
MFSRLRQAAIPEVELPLPSSCGGTPFDVAVAFRMMIGRAPVRDAEPCQRFPLNREEVNCVPLSVVR